MADIPKIKVKINTNIEELQTELKEALDACDKLKTCLDKLNGFELKVVELKTEPEIISEAKGGN